MSRPEDNPAPARAADASAEMLAGRGLPTILWNNDSDDLTWIAYPEHHPDGIPVPAPPGSPEVWNFVPAECHSVDDYLALRIGPLAKTKTQGLSYCGNFGTAVWNLRRDHIAALGDDPLQPILQFWKRDGRAFFFSMRMNDLHHVGRNGTDSWDEFRRTHWRLFLEPPTAAQWETEFVPWLEGKGQPPSAVTNYSALAYDYSRVEVRRYFLDTLREACRRYDLDGVEFDWLRYPVIFRRGEVNAATMTAFVGDARGILDEAAKRRGHPVRLVSRLPDTPEEALAAGLDVEAWLKAGTVDAVIAGNGYNFSSYPLERWVDLAHRHSVPVYGSVERQSHLKIPRYGSPETLRAAVATLWEKGADGLYFFNLFRPEELPLLDEFADRARLARLPKEYFIEPGGHNDLIPSNGPLPVELTSAAVATASLFIADDPVSAKAASLEILFQGEGAFAPPAITLNGHLLDGLAARRGAGNLTLSLSSPELKKALRRGFNEFRFTPPADAISTELTFAREWTVFGPCSDTAPAPAPADLSNCPATLRLGGAEFGTRQVKPTGRGVNLSAVFGGRLGREAAWVYIPLTAPLSGRFRIGLGADWWLEAFLDGKPLKSTLETGNGKNPPSRNDHVVEAELAAGKHLLAVRVLSGLGGWLLDVGPQSPSLTALSVRVAP
jgi:hypothetical protein